MNPELVAFAHRLADAARAETLPRWRTGLDADDKGGRDFDPVTDADREAERAMRALIEAEYPEHGIAGEEFPDRAASGPFCWSLDPVDGTRSFICGLPNWVTLIALLEDGAPVLGLIDAPCLGERYVGFEGAEGLRTSGCTALAEARLSTTDPYLFEDPGQWERLRGAARTVRYGHDGYAYARLAAGSLDLVVECGLKPHDYNALIPVVRAAGGMIGDWHGGEDFGAGNVIAAATRALYEEAVALLA
ncbi:MAG: inositol monophosphatase family protein [Alphaproteobacteria bacterium]|nr:MAG: inositol monophosphatase family protein [Alphaproteobacteria bacterium]